MNKNLNKEDVLGKRVSLNTLLMFMNSIVGEVMEGYQTDFYVHDTQQLYGWNKLENRKIKNRAVWMVRKSGTHMVINPLTFNSVAEVMGNEIEGVYDISYCNGYYTIEERPLRCAFAHFDRRAYTIGELEGSKMYLVQNFDDYGRRYTYEVFIEEDCENNYQKVFDTQKCFFGKGVTLEIIDPKTGQSKAFVVDCD